MQTNYVTEQEVKLLTDPDKIELPWRLIYRVLFYSGLRASELLRCKVSQLQSVDGGFYILLEDQKNQEKQEPTPLRIQDYTSLREFIELNKRQKDDYIFLNRLKTAFTTTWLNRRIKYHARRVGINRDLSSHAFRRGRIVDLRNKGYSYAEIKTITRHRDVNVLIDTYDKKVKKRASELVEK